MNYYFVGLFIISSFVCAMQTEKSLLLPKGFTQRPCINLSTSSLSDEQGENDPKTVAAHLCDAYFLQDGVSGIKIPASIKEERAYEQKIKQKLTTLLQGNPQLCERLPSEFAISTPRIQTSERKRTAEEDVLERAKLEQVLLAIVSEDIFFEREREFRQEIKKLRTRSGLTLIGCSCLCLLSVLTTVFGAVGALYALEEGPMP